MIATSRDPRSVLRRLGFALLAVLAVMGCASADRPIAPASGEDQLRIARLRYDRGDYTEAIELLTGYIQYHAESPDLDEAHFLLGMCHVQQRAWPLAVGEFLVVTSNHTDSRRLPDAHYWLGVSYWKQSRPAKYDQEPTRRALAQWTRFFQLYPDHPRADEARAMQQEGRDRLAEKSLENGKLYLVLKRWSPALHYFDDVLERYPESKWVERARVGRGEALLGLRRYEEAKAQFDDILTTSRDAEVRKRAEERMKKIPVAAPPVAPPATADSASENAG